MKRKVLHYLYFFGIKEFRDENGNEDFQYIPDQVAGVKEEHRRYLKELVAQEAERQSSIENKTSQLIGQCGLIFSLLGLFVPIFFDKFIDFSLYTKIGLILPFLLAFLFYILTIIKAIENYNISKYGYVTGSIKTVCQKRTIDEFITCEIKDLMYAVKINTKLNNRKGSNLLHAFRAFRVANICIGIMGVFISCLMLFYKKEPEATVPNQIISIEQTSSKLDTLDSVGSKQLGLKNSNANVLDTIAADTMKKKNGKNF